MFSCVQHSGIYDFFVSGIITVRVWVIFYHKLQFYITMVRSSLSVFLFVNIFVLCLGFLGFFLLPIDIDFISHFFIGF